MQQNDEPFHQNVIEFWKFKYYFKTIDSIIWFVEHVELSSKNNLRHYRECANKFGSLYTKEKTKILRPMRDLCLKMLGSGIDLTSIHIKYFEIICKGHFWKQALPLLERKALPSTKVDREYGHYVYLCSRINIKLGRLQQAYQNVEQIIFLSCPIKSEQAFQNIKNCLFLRQIMGKKTKIDDISQILENFKSNHPSFIQDNYQNYQNQKQQILQFIDQSVNAMIPALISHNQDNQLAQILARNWRYRPTRQILFEYKENRTERIKASNVDIDPENPEEVLRINTPTILVKCDFPKQKQRILYLQYRESTQEINTLITKSFQIFHLLERNRIRAEEDKPIT